MSLSTGYARALVGVGIGLLIAALPAHATEPDGRVAILARWVGEATPVGSAREAAVLRVELRPLVPLDAARLIVSFPPGIEVEPRTHPWAEVGPPEAAPAAGRALHIDLGRLDRATPGSDVEIRFTHPTGQGGVAALIVEAVTGDGRAIREAVGVAVGRPAAPGRRRLGAVEFPAAMVSPGSER